MRIASVVSGERNEFSAWIRIDSIARFLAQKGHEVEMVHFVNQPREGAKRSEGRHIRTSKMRAPIASYLALRDPTYDLVYGNTHEGALLSLPGRLSSKPVVFDMHGDILSEYLLDMEARRLKPSRKDTFLLKLIDRLDLSYSSLVQCVSRRMIEDLVSRGVRRERLAFIPNGIDLEEIRGEGKNSLREENRKLEEYDTVIGYAGRWNSWQGMPLLKDVIDRFQGKKVLFVLAGLDFRKFGQDNLICIPWMPRNKIWELYDVCDAMILPRSDCYVNEVAGPTKFAEYCAMGKPVISTPIGDPSDLIKEWKSGIVVKGFGTDDMVAGVEEFAAMDQEEVSKMGANSYQLYMDEFRWSQIMNRLEARLLELVQ